MGRTHAELKADIGINLKDTAFATFDTADVNKFMRTCLREVSNYSPLKIKEILTTTAGSYELDVSSITDVLRYDELEYKVGANPKTLRNFSEEEFGVIRMEIDTAPPSSATVYLMCAKAHHLDQDWVAATAYTLGQFVAPTTKNNKRYEVTVAGTSHSTEPTWPTTAGGTVADNSVTWTCRGEPSNSMPIDLEEIYSRYTAAKIAEHYSRFYVNRVNSGGARTHKELVEWSMLTLEQAKKDLSVMKIPSSYEKYSRAA